MVHAQVGKVHSTRRGFGLLLALALLAASLPLAVAVLTPTAPAAGVETPVPATISGGGSHSCGITVAGAAVCWGDNAVGKLGNGTTTASTVPVPVSGLTSGVVAISAGTASSCAIDGDGAVWCWGSNDHGLLGNGRPGEASSVPVRVTGLSSGATAISVGSVAACAVVSGAATCWGYAGYGILGDGTQNSSSVPVPVSGLDSGVTAISIAFASVCAAADGEAWCWGRNANGELGDGTGADSYTPVRVSGLSEGVTAVTTGNDHSCAVVSGGVRCWGDNVSGQLGDGTTTDAPTPVVVSGLTGEATQVTAGNTHTCALVDGSPWCWGASTQGALGATGVTSSAVPVQVSGLASPVVALDAGASHTCAVAQQEAQCWGSNSNGQLGTGTTSNTRGPVATAGLEGATALSGGLTHTCAIVAGGARCWGVNGARQIGDGSTSGAVRTPTQVIGLASGVTAVAAGANHSCAAASGAARCWGSNADGQLGNGSTTPSGVPVAVSGLATGVTDISAGTAHTCAVVSGAAWCWGRGTSGQLGDGAGSTSSVPVPVSGLTSGVTAIAAGANHSCAVASGAVWCWGSAGLGNGAETSSVPVQVSGLSSGATAVDVGNLHSCALVDGAAWCWGGPAPQLGHGGTASATPVAVSGMSSGVTRISTYGNHTCAVRDGAASCWGSGSNGQLGTGVFTSSASVPVAVAGLGSGVTTIAAGGNHSCAVASGSGSCWGQGSAGQLGQGEDAPRAVSGDLDFAGAPGSRPTVADVATATAAGVAVDVAVVGEDADDDPLTYAVVDQPDHGTYTDGRYVPARRFTGVDTIGVTATDPGGLTSDEATITIYVGVGPVVGTVTDDATDQPLGGIQVALVRSTGTVAKTVASAGDGRYDLGAVVAGTYTVRWTDSARGYVTELSDEIVVAPSATPLVRDAALTPLGRVSGTVTSSATGTGLDGIQVRLVPVGGTGGLATTTVDGAYDIRGLAAGEYQMWFRSVGAGAGYVSEWWDESPTQTGSTTVTVADGDQQVIDESLAPVAAPPARSGVVAGTVTSAADGAPIAGLQVRLYPAPYTASMAATTGADGTYRFERLPAGSYKVFFRDATGRRWVSEHNGDAPSLAEAEPVAVADGQTRTVDAALTPVAAAPVRDATITGTVTDPDGGPIAGIQVRLYVAGETGSAATTTDAEGRYTFAGRLPGQYQLYFRRLDGPWVSEWNGDATSQAEAPPISVPSGTTTVDATLARR